MKIVLLVVGKTKEDYLQSAIDMYLGRLKYYIPFEIEVIPELRNTKSLSIDQQKEAEGELILKKVEGGDVVWLLDEKGKQFTSVDFAQTIERLTHQVSKRLIFVVGGPYGFSEAVYQAASQKISLSKMTFSHQMIRLLFVEQIYRAMTILRGEPYHHE